MGLLDWVGEDCEDGRKAVSKHERCGDWDTDAKKFEVRISLRNEVGVRLRRTIIIFAVHSYFLPLIIIFSRKFIYTGVQPILPVVLTLYSAGALNGTLFFN